MKVAEVAFLLQNPDFGPIVFPPKHIAFSKGHSSHSFGLVN